MLEIPELTRYIESGCTFSIGLLVDLTTPMWPSLFINYILPLNRSWNFIVFPRFDAYDIMPPELLREAGEAAPLDDISRNLAGVIGSANWAKLFHDSRMSIG